jgi:hypothetical protein
LDPAQIASIEIIFISIQLDIAVDHIVVKTAKFVTLK